MKTQEPSADVREQYVSETHCHMKLLTDRLQALVQKQSHCMDDLWSLLNQQEEASRNAGYSGVSRLCRQMRACLKEAEEGGPTPLPITAKAMLAVCRSIQLHASMAHRPAKSGKTYTQSRPLGAGPPAPHEILSWQHRPECCARMDSP